MEEQTCRGCQKNYPIKSIIQHVNKSSCRQTYSDDQYTSLQALLKEISAAKKKIKNAQRYLNNKTKIAATNAENYDPTKRAEKYSAKKVEIAQRNSEMYDPLQRAKKYSENRSEILRTYNPTKRAKKYLAKKDEIARKNREIYDPIQRAEKYSKNRTKILRKYKPNERAKKYSMKKTEISNKNLEKYDPMKRHLQYEKDRVKISLGYYKRRSIKANRYEKDLRRIKYKKVMAKIAKQRKELKKKKECKGGKVFSELCRDVCLNGFHKIKNGNIDFALGMQEDRVKEYEDNVHDPIFEKESWSTSIFHYKTYDCEQVNNCSFALRVIGCKEPKPCDELNSKYTNHRGRKQWCIQHMDESEWDDIIFDAMMEKLQEETEKSRMKDAKIEAGREMKLAFDRYYSPLFLPSMYSDVADRSCNKAFKTLFFEKDSEIYERAKSTAILKWHESKDEKEFSEFLIEELEASGVYVSEKISKIFEDNFLFALEQKFSFFKESLPDEMRSKNTKQKEWALKMLLKIKEEDSMNKEKEKLIENAKVQIEEIYQKYEEEITAAYKNCEVPFEDYFCFTDVVNLYPTFKGPREDPLFNNLTDNYEVCFENLLQVIEQREFEKCKAGQVFSQVCDKVFPDYFDKITGDHLHYALYLENEDREDYENDTTVIDDIIEDELWIENFNTKTFDCREHKRYHASGMPLSCNEIAKQLSKESASNEKKCLSHMTNSEFGILVEKSMDDTLSEEIDKLILVVAKEKVKREFELVFGKGYSPLVLPSIYIEVDEMSQSKAFKKLFLKKDSKLYEDAKQSALNKWKKSEYKKELTCFLIEELEASGVHVSDKILQIFKEGLIDTLDEKFELFKERLPFEMKSKNSERRKWAMKKLEKIEAAEKDLMEKGTKPLIENARNQINKIYEKYEKKITDAYENCNVSYEVPFHSFSEVVEEYPNFEGPREDPLFNSLGDQYTVWFEEICKEIEIRKEKCKCYSCLNNLYLTDECERVIRQRQLEMIIRTCPLCQKNIPSGWFDENWHFKRDH